MVVKTCKVRQYNANILLFAGQLPDKATTISPSSKGGQALQYLSVEFGLKPGRQIPII